jgi:uncharacterized membrane protein
MECSMGEFTVDILAVGFFVLEWSVYAFTLERSTYGLDSLSARMHVYCERWIRRVLDRDARMVDMQIMISLQNGTPSSLPPACLRLVAGLRSCAPPTTRWPCSPSCRSTSVPRPRSGK